MSEAAITVIIPCFNCAKTLERCVDAVLEAIAQAPLEARVVLVDGGSTDRSAELCRALARHEKVSVLSAEKSSASAKRNAAIATVSSEFLLFTDPDCIPSPNWISAYAPVCEAWSCCTGQVLPHGSGLETSIRKSPRDKSFRPSLWNRALPFRPGSSNNLLIKRSLIEELGGFPEDLGPGTPNGVAEDTEVLYKALAHGVTIRYVAAASILHDHPENEATFLQKKEAYGEGLSFFLFRRYAGDPAAWLSFGIMVGHSFLRLLLHGGLARRQAWGELRGRLRGAYRAFLSPESSEL